MGILQRGKVGVRWAEKLWVSPAVRPHTVQSSSWAQLSHLSDGAEGLASPGSGILPSLTRSFLSYRNRSGS